MPRHCRRLLLAAAALLPVMARAAPLVVPSGLPPGAQDWFKAYVAADNFYGDKCAHAVNCQHYPPPIYLSDEADTLRGQHVPPLSDLPSADAFAIARVFLARNDYPHANELRPQLMGFTPSASMPAISFTDLLAKVIAVVLVFGVPGVVLYFLGTANKRLIQKFANVGYVSPIAWGQTNTKGERTGKRLVTPDLLAVRSAMPPFILWYEEGANDGLPHQPRTKWVYVVDGNKRLEVPGSEMDHYIQLGNVDGGIWLKLFSISPDVAKNLNRGTYRTEDVPMISHPEGKRCSFFLHMGGVAAPMPLPPRSAGATHGSSGVGDGNIDAEPA